MALLAALVLGLSAGALLAEAAVLVPFWRRMPPEEFLAWYEKHAALLLRFFGPLELLAALAATVAAGAAGVRGQPGFALLAAAAVLAVAVLAAFPLYFQRVNASFADASIAPDDVPAELGRWSRWHGLRVALASAAFAAALLATRSQ